MIRVGSSFVTVGGGFVEYSGPIVPPEPPVDNYFQLTNRGSSEATLYVTSGSNGQVFINDEFMGKFTANAQRTFTVPAGAIVKITGLSPRGNSLDYGTLNSNSSSNNFSIDRFDNSISNPDYMFCRFNGLKSITSWAGAENYTVLHDTFAMSTGLATLPASWNGLGNVTQLIGTFNSCGLTSIPSSYAGLGKLTRASHAFAVGAEGTVAKMTTGGDSGLETLSDLTWSEGMFWGQSLWTGNAKAVYDYLKTKSIKVSNYDNTFTNCTSSTGYNHIPTSWGGGMTLPTHYLQFTNFGSNLCKIAIYSTTSGTAYVDDDFAADVTASTTTATVVEMPAGSVLKLSGLTPKHDANRPLFSDVSGYTGSLSLDRFDDTIQSYEFAFSSWVIPFTSMKRISSWAGASNITAFKDTFNSSGLTSIPSSWSGLDSLTNMWGMFNGCTSLTAIPDSWSGLNNVTSMYCAFSDNSGLLAGGSTGFSALSKVTNMWYTFKGCTQWTGDAKAMYDYMSTKSITVTDHANTFLNCTNTVGYYQIPSSWGGGRS